MKVRLFTKCPERDKWRLGTLIMAGAIFCALSGTAWSIESRGLGNPIGPGTVPPSSIRNGLIRSPNPVDTSGNLIVTGNVGGGKHFRGPVPYRSTTEFGAPLGSSSLSSFLRYSAGSDDFDRYTAGHGVQPYYSPTATVTTMTPGRSGVFTPSTTRITDRAPETFGLEDVPKRETLLPWQGAPDSDVRLRQIPLSPQRIEKLTSEEGVRYPLSERLTPERYQEQMEQMRRNLQRMSEKASELKQGAAEKSDSLQLPTKVELSERVRQQLEEPGIVETQTPLPQKQTQEAPALKPAEPMQKQQLEGLPSLGKERASGSGVYESIKQQLDKLQTSQTKEEASTVTGKDFEQPAATESGRTSLPDGKEQSSKEKPYLGKGLRKSLSGVDESNLEALDEMELEKAAEKKSSVVDEVERLSAAQLSAEAKRIMGPHKDIESLSQANFNQHILAARTYLKQGRYYRAADSFALASIYKRDDPGAYAGRAYALFAAGEYISSALFLSRALEISPEYVQTKVDLVALLGDKNKLDSRIANVEEWLEKTGTAELRFLLGYIYYRTGNLNRAKQAIDTAYDKLPQSPAVQAVKKAIYDAIASPKAK